MEFVVAKEIGDGERRMSQGKKWNAILASWTHRICLSLLVEGIHLAGRRAGPAIEAKQGSSIPILV